MGASRESAFLVPEINLWTGRGWRAFEGTPQGAQWWIKHKDIAYALLSAGRLHLRLGLLPLREALRIPMQIHAWCLSG